MNFAMNKKEDFSPIKQTLDPIYVGSSVIGIKFDKGIIIACDVRLNYGHLCKHMDVEGRLLRLTERTIFGYSGEYSDTQETSRILKSMILDDQLSSGENSFLGPVELTNYLAELHYYQRNRMNPFLNSIVSGGINWNGEPVLLNIDQFGTLLTGNYFTTSMSHYFCNAILREDYGKDPKSVNLDKALVIIKKCFEVMLYRHLLAGNVIKYMVMKTEDGGKTIQFEENKFEVTGKWDYNMWKNMGNENAYLIS